MPNTTPKTRKKPEVLKRRAEFLTLLQLGLTHGEIARAFGFSRTNITYHISKVNL